MLHVVATPIGNLADLSPRAIDALRGAAAIACEDTRRTWQLLTHFEIPRPAEMFSYRQGNEERVTEKVLSLLAEGKDVILEIEVQGGMQVKALFPDSVLLFVVPPSAEELLNRLRKRGTENDTQIGLRFEQTVRETRYIKDYDYVILNDDVDRAVNEVHNIIESQRARPKFQGEMIRELSFELSRLIQESNL